MGQSFNMVPIQGGVQQPQVEQPKEPTQPKAVKATSKSPGRGISPNKGEDKKGALAQQTSLIDPFAAEKEAERLDIEKYGVSPQYKSNNLENANLGVIFPPF